ncbi:uncharacterized protein znf518b isoform 1-T2 [Pholidichthys leucotaenia]
MNPVSYQTVPTSLNLAHPTPALDRLLSTSNLMSCEKCGFVSTDAAAYKKHMLEHMGTRFYCFYCNSVSYSEAELKEHLKQHTSKYTFKCPHCGQGYMRRRCLVKHIDRFHSQGPAKPVATKNPPVPVSSALTGAHTAEPSSPRPLVRVTVPAPASTSPAIRTGKDEQRGKTLDTTVSSTTNGSTELTQHDRALTVSLPPEVIIPAGCLVELIEVKTVNGTKELKLRLVSQQENRSVIKDTRMLVSQNTSLGKPLSSTSINNPNTVTSTSVGACTVNRKQCETKVVNVERPAGGVPGNVSNNPPSQVSKDKSGLKRPTVEIINLDCDTVIPNKVSKTIHNTAREGNSGIRVSQASPVNHSAVPPPLISTRVGNRPSPSLRPDTMGISVSQRVGDDRNNVIQKSIPARRPSEGKSSRDVSMGTKLEHGEIRLKYSPVPKTLNEMVSSNPQGVKSAPLSLSVPVAPVIKVRPPASLVSKDKIVTQPFALPRTVNVPSSMKTPVLTRPNNTNSVRTWTQEVRPVTARQNAVSEPESFPVISSVFSLSQPSASTQGPMQPLVTALRGIVMDKSSIPDSPANALHKINTEHTKQAPASRGCAQVAVRNISSVGATGPTLRLSEPVKEEKHANMIHHPPAVTNNHIHVKEEEKCSTSTDKKCVSNPAPAAEESKISSPVKAPATAADPQQQVIENNHAENESSKFLTVTLKKVQVGVWKKTKKGLKCKSRERVDSTSYFYPLPLKVDQPVKRPGPYQPVVVLNHPKPGALVQRTAETVADAGACDVAPEFHILKMRLRKVMRRKYKVTAFIVRILP